MPTWNTLVMKAVPNAARVAAYKFGMSVRLMRNICLWNKVLSMPVLEKLALDDLLSGKILPHLRSIQSNVHDAVTRTERIIASLCGVWSGSSVTGERRYVLLGYFTLCILNFQSSCYVTCIDCSLQNPGIANVLQD